MKQRWNVPFPVSVLALAAIAVGPWPAWASHQTCDCHSMICSGDGFEKTLVNFAIDPLAGTSSWTYEVCNQAKGKKVCSPNKCTGGTLDGKACTSQDCPGAQCVAGFCNAGSNDGQACVNDDCPNGTCDVGGGGGTGQTGDDCTTDAGCAGVCVPCAPRHDLSHVDIVLPGLGECVSGTQEISIKQVGCTACNPVLVCSMSDIDNSCPKDLCAPGSAGKFCDAASGVKTGDACQNSGDCSPGKCVSIPCQPISSPVPLKVLKCNLADGSNLDPGECVTIQVTIAGESPTVGPGQIQEVTKAATGCTSEELCGPACDCAPHENKCLTRTAGFWGNHPAITGQFLPVTVCGKSLTITNATGCGSNNSATEALCIAPGVEANKTCDRNPAYQQLVRQCTAAGLNLAATAGNGGTCGAAIQTTIASCCSGAICSKNQSAISNSGCIQALDTFNNSQDTFAVTPLPFSNPGPANPAQCQLASGNGCVIGKNCGLCYCK